MAYLLYGSWIALTLAVVSTIVSFWVSQCAIDVQLKKAEDYYLHGDKKAQSKSRIAKTTDCVNYFSGIFFVLGVFLATVFVIVNFERELKMDSDKKGEQVRLTEGSPIPQMQEVLEKHGMPIPNIQPLPQKQPSQSQPTDQSNTATPSANSAPPEGKKK